MLKKKLLLGDLVGPSSYLRGSEILWAGRSHHKEVMCMTRNHSIILYKLLIGKKVNKFTFFVILGAQYFVAGMSHNKQLETSYKTKKYKTRTKFIHTFFINRPKCEKNLHFGVSPIFRAGTPRHRGIMRII